LLALAEAAGVALGAVDAPPQAVAAKMTAIAVAMIFFIRLCSLPSA
jgi:hypothetical protein